MDELAIIRSLLRRITKGVPATAPIAKAVLDWARPYRDWLIPAQHGALTWDTLLAHIAEPRLPSTRTQVLDLADAVARLLALSPFDAALLRLMVAFDRLPRIEALARVASRNGHDLPVLLGVLAGASPQAAGRAVRVSLPVRLGLANFVNRRGELDVDIGWVLERLLDRAPTGDDALLEALIGRQQRATLTLTDFAHVTHADFLVRLIAGALAEKPAGVNVLIHGPPCTGKTELARTLAQAASATLHAVGEADEDGDEPNRGERVVALSLAQRLLGSRSAPAGDAVLLFDEMEDLIGNARPSGGDWFIRREGSKVFVNRLLETNPVPVIWTTNALGNIDRAILRRMSFVLRLDVPPRRVAQSMLDRIATDEGVSPGPEFGALLDAAPEAATVLRVAARAGRLAGEGDGGARAAEALVRALRGGELPPPAIGAFDCDLFETDLSLDALVAGMANTADVSLLLTGPPGVGKTAFAHHLARAVDRPLLVKRASDLLSKWVGETEAQIADAFAEARRQEAILLFDEADSLLFDRSTARTTWEVGQVNELLTWLDRHPLPVIAATNHEHRLDPATLRRFVFKLRLCPLGRERAARAFERFFGCSAPFALAQIENLTPGDFSVVARQLRFAPARDAADLVERLRREVAAKPERIRRIGF